MVETVATPTSITAATLLRRNRCRAQGVRITSGIGDLEGVGQGRTAPQIAWPAFGHTARASVPWTWRPHLMMVANIIGSLRGCTVRTEFLLRTEVRRFTPFFCVNGCLFGLLIVGFTQCRLNIFLNSVCLQRIIPTVGSLKRTCSASRLRPPQCKREYTREFMT